jgi:hypothetical protein
MTILSRDFQMLDGRSDVARLMSMSDKERHECLVGARQIYGLLKPETHRRAMEVAEILALRAQFTAMTPEERAAIVVEEESA